MIETERSALEARSEEVYRIAYQRYCQAPDWATFYREILGLSGLIRRKFPAADGLAEFERSETYQQIQQLLKSLRERKTIEGVEQEETRVITVRLPQSLHEALRVEAHEHRTSVNKLCITKLLQFIDEDLVPDESKKFANSKKEDKGESDAEEESALEEE